MSDILQSKAEEKGGEEKEVTIIRMKLKNKEYCKLCCTAREQNCTPVELVVRCIRHLLDT